MTWIKAYPQWLKPILRWTTMPIHSYFYARECKQGRWASVLFAWEMSATSQWDWYRMGSKSFFRQWFDQIESWIELFQVGYEDGRKGYGYSRLKSIQWSLFLLSEQDEPDDQIYRWNWVEVINTGDLGLVVNVNCGYADVTLYGWSEGTITRFRHERNEIRKVEYGIRIFMRCIFFGLAWGWGLRQSWRYARDWEKGLMKQ